MTRLRRLEVCHYVQNGGSRDQKFSFKRSAQVITMAKDKVKQQAGELQVFDPQDLFNRLISLALVLTSGGGDGLPISLTKIMGYELSQFPASLFETEYLMLATNKPQIIQMLIKAFYKLEGAE